MAMTHSPTRSSSESPSVTGVRSGASSILMTAMSVFGSRPTTFALYSLSFASLHDDLVGVLDDVVVGEN